MTSVAATLCKVGRLSYYPCMYIHPAMLLQLRHDRKGPGGSGDGERPKEIVVDETDQGHGGRKLVCVQCKHTITREGARIPVMGQHRHVFCNPHGMMFELGCFSQAPGCAVLGPSSLEFTWFSGYSWQVALCSGCGLHMGWLFRGVRTEGAFFGLILPNLVESDEE